MITVYRYRTMKPEDGQIEFTFHRDGTIIGFVESWHTDKGWETIVDVLVDTELPVEKRQYFLCTAGDNLDALGEQAFAYHVATNTAKSYVSYLFDISHLPDQLRAQLRADRTRLRRPKPERDELSRTVRAIDDRRIAAKRPQQREGRVYKVGEEPNGNGNGEQEPDEERPAKTAAMDVAPAPSVSGDVEPPEQGFETGPKERPRWWIRG